METLQCKAGPDPFFPGRVKDVKEKGNLSRTAENHHDRACFD